MLLSNFITEMRAMRGKHEKIAHLKRYDSVFFRELMEATFNPFRHFNVTMQRQLMKQYGETDLSEVADEIRTLLMELELSASSKQNRQKVLDITKNLDRGSQEFLKGILNKKPKIGVGQRILLQTFPGLFVPFNPQKGHRYDPTKDYKVPIWYATPKYNGIRAVCLYKGSMWRLYTYTGHEIETCDHIIPDLEIIRKKYGYTMVDGELYNEDLTFNQIESAVLSATRPESGFKAGIILHSFTAGVEKYFSAEQVEGFVPKLPNHKGTWAILIPSIPLKTAKEIKDFYHWCIEHGYEGAVLRNPDVPYAFSKTNAMLKVKKDSYGDNDISDCLVVEIIAGEIPIANKTGGYDYVPAMVALRVEQPDGLLCKVGGGYSNDFKIKVLAGETDVLDHVIEVKHEGWGDRGRMIFPQYKLTRHLKDKNEAS
ncbi:MAG TPA: hypothetical protein ENL19_02290 [candidate division WOR-3 bacterium]|uniref:Uncharacterized protein n=1 Tax=candidate division WOR-3 bacterium TaxID=2052148 RepID=A0A7C5HFX6_UNCW3|nr:hypothetical protein [candidate division WOR-3 bacterium]